MKTLPSSGICGAVLVFALLIMVVAAGILGGIAQVAVTQTIAGQAEWPASARRIELENSRALARQYILSQAWRDYGSLSAASLSIAGLGGFSINSIDPPEGYWLSLQQDEAARVNPFNIFERGGFQSTWASGTLLAGGSSVPWGFQIRTRSPIVAGFAFVNQRPTTNVWQPTQRIDMQQTNYASGFAALPRMPVSSITNSSLAASAVRMTNLGFLEVPKAEASFGDLLGAVTGVTTNAIDPLNPVTAQVEIDLDTFSYFVGQSDCQFYEVPSFADVVFVSNGTTNTNFTVPVGRLILSGGSSSAATPVQILVSSDNLSLTNVALSGNNARLVYLYRQGSGSPPLFISTTGGNREFRIGMTLECPADLRISGGLSIVGGIRTGSALTQSSGDTLMLLPESNATWKYDAIADRMMWMEDQRMR